MWASWPPPGWSSTPSATARLGVDLIALLALCGALVVHEELAGAVIAVMLATGRALEAWAAGRASRELRALAERAPRQAHRHGADELQTVPLETVAPGDLIMVRPGEVVPLDGLMVGAAAVTDESALTGEPVPVEHPTGNAVRSGVVNSGGPFDLRVTTSAAESTHAGILRLVEEATASTPPFVRLADRFAAWFLAATLIVAEVACAVSGELSRAVPVLVVATPCPLILAAPVAFVSGLSRTAQRGVVVKGGGVLERLARCRTLLFDKTGTITTGRLTVSAVVPAASLSTDETLRLAASLDQVSPHVLAGAVVQAAIQRDLPLTFPSGVYEVPGRGVRGRVDRHDVTVGRADWVGVTPGADWARRVRRRAGSEGALTVFIGVDGIPAGLIVLDDPIRPDAGRSIRAHDEGVSTG